VTTTESHESVQRRRIYVTGHRNPDLDSIAAAIGYSELKNRLDSDNEYVPVRLGEVNAQTSWALERSGAEPPVRDVMRESFTVARHSDPVRSVGLTMARENLDIVPIVDSDGQLAGVMTERALAHRYIRESRKTSTLVDAPTTVAQIVEVLDGELIQGEDRMVEGRVWVHSIDPGRSESKISSGDVVVVGNRVDAQRQALELGAALLVASNGVRPEREILDLAADKDATVVLSPLDSYVSSRMVTLAAPCRALADTDPLTVDRDDLVAEIAEQIKDVHYRAAVAVDSAGKPCGLITRSDLVSPRPRRVLLVDHAEQAQSVPGVEEAEIVEILDHHHIGSIETRIPVRATFDPVGSTATLVVERFRQNGMEPSRTSAGMLLGAVLSDTVLLNSPTTTERDRVVVAFLERALGVDAM
jgi:manganese-dependent inorganic pyrophosphatase